MPLTNRTRTSGRVTISAVVACFVIATQLSAAEDDRTREKSDDLIQLMNLDRDTVAGQWRKTPDGLLTSAANGSRISLPVEPKGEYDFTVTFTRQTGQHSIALLFVSGSGQAAWISAATWKNMLMSPSISSSSPLYSP